MDKKEEFLRKLKETFRAEAEETIGKMSEDLIKLENNPSEDVKAELLEVIYRAAHSLKGASRAVNETHLELLCHTLEDFMDSIKIGIYELNETVFDLLHQTSDLLLEILHLQHSSFNPVIEDKVTSQVEKLKNPESHIISDTEEPEDIEIIPTNTVEKPIESPEIQNSVTGTSGNDSKKTITQNISTSQKSINQDTIRISVEKLDKLLNQAEELLSLKLSAIYQTEHLQNTLDNISIWEKEYSKLKVIYRNLSPSDKKNDSDYSGKEKGLQKIVDFTDWSESQIKSIKNELKELHNLSHQEVYTSGIKIENLLENIKEFIKTPFSTLLNNFPKMVRDIAKDLGKEIDFVVEGDDVEIDRRLLEKMRSPLIHIMRNSIDYGIELPSIRKTRNKKSRGTISIKIDQLEDGNIEVVIRDDGAGINIEKLRQVYKNNEGVSEEEALKVPEQQLIQYIFKSRVSTSEIVTDLSGRGLGLTIVQETVEKLGGSINAETEIGKSTTIKINLPQTIVTFKGVLLSLENHDFVLPTLRLKSVIHLNKDDIKTVDGKNTILFDDEIIPISKLSDILELNIKDQLKDVLTIIIIEIKGTKSAFIIDRIQKEREILVKRFNKQLEHVRNISGATILGSGRIVPILNVYDLYKSAQKLNLSESFDLYNSLDEDEAQKSILIVEDSITSRTLLKNILESAGYNVTTAVDGVDGFTKLKSNEFDAVVTDVEMPRMDGFELTTKIRSEKRFKDLPVVLVTSLSKREDREKGIDVGANAYIIKSSFEQSNLLETLERLI